MPIDSEIIDQDIKIKTGDMRFEMTMERTGKLRMIPMDYQYYISAWIYKVIKRADIEFARFLHDEGYGTDNTKLYKLFCFSRLDIGRPILWSEKKLFEVPAHVLFLKVSFDAPEAASKFIQGLFMEQGFYLGDKFNGIDLKVVSVTALPEPVFGKTMKYKLITPWVVSFQPEGEKYSKYLDPGDKLFRELSVKHLVEKYKNTRGKEISLSEIAFTPENTYKRAGFLVKNGTPLETRVIGNLFSFELKAPAGVHQMLWNAGVSEKSSNGFGWCEIDIKQTYKTIEI